ncbi:MAG TPA: MFS transporter [Cyclobacteriaceae bacterium]|nr:MFS transporter [Cyclobacteriaceae bacterium]
MSDLAPKKFAYNTQFWLLCLSSLLFFASFNMMIPELPFHLTKLGGADYKGLIISLFTLTAMISRPFSGKLADKLGRKPVILAGSLVCVASSLLYPMLSTVFGFLLLRLIHGFSTGFTPTGQAAYLSDVIPANRRGEAMGLLGTAGTLGMSGGLAIGPWMTSAVSVNAMFYLSAFFALMSASIVLSIKETIRERHAISWRLLEVHRRDLFEPRVLVPCLIMAMTAYAYGNLFTIVPDFGLHVGIPKEDSGLLFAYFTLASLMVRLIGGKASDIFGRVAVLRVSTFLMMTGMLWIGMSTTPKMLIMGAFIYGLAQGATSPTLLAWAADLSDPEHKGRGVASLYIFMEFGIGIGALLSGFLYGNNASQFILTFVVSSVLSGISFLYLWTSPVRRVMKPYEK